MKYLLITFFSLFLLKNSWALDPQAMTGTFTWGGHIYLNESLITEGGKWNTSDGQARMKELRHEGYNCYRKSPEKFNCLLKSDHETLPSEIEQFATNYVKSFKAEFTGPFEDPRDMMNTSTEHDWWIAGDVLINGAKVEGYKWSYQFETNKSFIVFPISDEQPTPYFLFHSPELVHLPLQIQQKHGTDKTTNFLLEVDLKLVK